jgi:hypothetical protein
MSKAFTQESDGDDDDERDLATTPPCPAGSRTTSRRPGARA